MEESPSTDPQRRVLRLPFRIVAWILGPIGLLATLMLSGLASYDIAKGDFTTGALQTLLTMLGGVAVSAIILYAAWSGKDPYRRSSAGSDANLTRKQVVAAFIIFGVWGSLGYAVHRYPHSRLLVWLFWMSIIGVFLPRFILLGVGLYREARRLRSN